MSFALRLFLPYESAMTDPQHKNALPDLAAFLRQPRRGVLAPASGGCVQYLFSANVEVVPLPDGGLGVHAPDRTEAQQHLLHGTTLSLRLPLQTAADGTELSQLILTGHLDAPPPAGEPARFIVVRAHIADISGAVRTLDADAIGHG
jgi:hypothetical protein